MKVYELQEGKEYTARKCRWEIRENKLHVYSDNAWRYCKWNYNDVIDLDFTEVARIPDENTPIDTRVRVKDHDIHKWEERNFAFINHNAVHGYYYGTFANTSQNSKVVTFWKYCEII